MSKKPKWVIFDVGGVLYDFNNFQKELAEFLKIDEKLVTENIDKLILNSMEGQMSETEFWKNILAIFKLEHKLESVMRLWLDGSRLMKPTALLMNDLHKKGYKIGLLTNNWNGMTDKLYKDLSPYADLKFIFESAVEKISKPDKRLYEIVEKRTKAKEDEIFFIDDRVENLETAKKMGWQTFLFNLRKDAGQLSSRKIRKLLL